MFCKDIFDIIGSFLYNLKDIIALRNVNKITRKCKYNITLYTRRVLPKFIYNDFNIIKICSTFSDYSNVEQLMTDKLLHLSISCKDNSKILDSFYKLSNLKTLRVFSNRLTDNSLSNLSELTSLNLGCYSKFFIGHSLIKLKNLTFLNLGDNYIHTNFVNNLTKLEHLFINTIIRSFDFSLLTNLKTLDVSKSEYTLTDSNICTLINLKSFKCKYSTITTVDHLINLEVLFIGVNYTLHKISLCNLKILSIVNSTVNSIDSPKLIELTLSDFIKDSTLCKHTELKYLYMGNNTRITDNGIKTLINLNYIHCNINRNITIDSILNFSNLIYLHAGLSHIKLNKLNKLKKIQYVEQYESYLGNLESVILLDNRTNIK